MLKPNSDYSLCLKTDCVSWVQVVWLMGDKGQNKNIYARERSIYEIFKGALLSLEILQVRGL